MVQWPAPRGVLPFPTAARATIRKGMIGGGSCVTACCCWRAPACSPPARWRCPDFLGREGGGDRQLLAPARAAAAAAADPAADGDRRAGAARGDRPRRGPGADLGLSTARGCGRSATGRTPPAILSASSWWRCRRRRRSRPARRARASSPPRSSSRTWRSRSCAAVRVAGGGPGPDAAAAAGMSALRAHAVRRAAARPRSTGWCSTTASGSCGGSG